MAEDPNEKKPKDSGDEQKPESSGQSLDQVQSTSDVRRRDDLSDKRIADDTNQRREEDQKRFEQTLTKLTPIEGGQRMASATELLAGADPEKTKDGKGKGRDKGDRSMLPGEAPTPSDKATTALREIMARNMSYPAERHAIAGAERALQANAQKLPAEQREAYAAVGSALVRGDNAALQRAMQKYGADPNFAASMEALGKDLKGSGVVVELKDGTLNVKRDADPRTVNVGSDGKTRVTQTADGGAPTELTGADAARATRDVALASRRIGGDTAGPAPRETFAMGNLTVTQQTKPDGSVVTTVNTADGGTDNRPFARATYTPGPPPTLEALNGKGEKVNLPLDQPLLRSPDGKQSVMPNGERVTTATDDPKKVSVTEYPQHDKRKTQTAFVPEQNGGVATETLMRDGTIERTGTDTKGSYKSRTWNDPEKGELTQKFYANGEVVTSDSAGRQLGTSDKPVELGRSKDEQGRDVALMSDGTQVADLGNGVVEKQWADGPKKGQIRTEYPDGDIAARTVYPNVNDGVREERELRRQTGTTFEQDIYKGGVKVATEGRGTDEAGAYKSRFVTDTAGKSIEQRSYADGSVRTELPDGTKVTHRPGEPLNEKPLATIRGADGIERGLNADGSQSRKTDEGVETVYPDGRVELRYDKPKTAKEAGIPGATDATAGMVSKKTTYPEGDPRGYQQRFDFVPGSRGDQVSETIAKTPDGKQQTLRELTGANDGKTFEREQNGKIVETRFGDGRFVMTPENGEPSSGHSKPITLANGEKALADVDDRTGRFTVRMADGTQLKPGADGKWDGDTLKKLGFSLDAKDAKDGKFSMRVTEKGDLVADNGAGLKQYLRADGSRVTFNEKDYSRTREVNGVVTKEHWDGYGYRKATAVKTEGDKTVLEFEPMEGRPKVVERDSKSDSLKVTFNDGSSYAANWKEQKQVFTSAAGETSEFYNSGRVDKDGHPVWFRGQVGPNGEVSPFTDKMSPQEKEEVRQRILKGEQPLSVRVNKQNGEITASYYRGAAVTSDGRGNVNEVAYPNGQSYKFQRDDDGKLTRVVAPDGTVHQKPFNATFNAKPDGTVEKRDAEGNLTVTEGNGRGTISNKQGQPFRVIEPNGQTWNADRVPGTGNQPDKANQRVWTLQGNDKVSFTGEMKPQPDGTIAFATKDGVVRRNDDNSTSRLNDKGEELERNFDNGAYIKVDPETGMPKQTRDVDGNVRDFEYEKAEDGSPKLKQVKLTTPDGKTSVEEQNPALRRNLDGSEFRYGTDGKLTSATLRKADGSLIELNAQGQPTEIKERVPNSNPPQYKTIALQNPRDQQLRLLDASGKPEGARVLPTKDGYAEQKPDGGYMTKRPGGAVDHLDASGRLQYSTDAQGRLQRTVDERGGESKFVYENGKLARIEHRGSEHDGVRISKPDAATGETKVTLGGGRVETYNPDGKLLRKDFADGAFMQFNPNTGNPTKTKDVYGVERTFNYKPDGKWPPETVSVQKPGDTAATVTEKFDASTKQLREYDAAKNTFGAFVSYDPQTGMRRSMSQEIGKPPVVKEDRLDGTHRELVNNQWVETNRFQQERARAESSRPAAPVERVVQPELNESISESDRALKSRPAIEKELQGTNEAADKVTLAHQRRALEAHIDTLPEPQKAEMKRNLELFEARAKQEKFTEQQIAQTLYQANRLLEADPAAIRNGLDRADFARTAQAFMHGAAIPNETNQGFHQTCNTSVVREQMLTKEPWKAGQVAADVMTSKDGIYTAPDGQKVRIDYASMHADREALVSSQNSKSADRSGLRDQLGQVMDHVFSNYAHQKLWKLDQNLPPEAVPDKPFYRQVRPNMGPKDTGERFEYPGELPMIHSGVRINQVADIANGFLGRNSVITNKDTDPHADRTVRISTEAELTRELDAGLAKGPMALMVNDGHPAIQDGNRRGGMHVVSVVESQEIGGKKYYRVSDQVGTASDKWVSAQDLFNATKLLAKDGKYAPLNDQLYRTDNSARPGDASLVVGDAPATATLPPVNYLPPPDAAAEARGKQLEALSKQAASGDANALTQLQKLQAEDAMAALQRAQQGTGFVADDAREQALTRLTALGVNNPAAAEALKTWAGQDAERQAHLEKLREVEVSRAGSGRSLATQARAEFLGLSDTPENRTEAFRRMDQLQAAHILRTGAPDAALQQERAKLTEATPETMRELKLEFPDIAYRMNRDEANQLHRELVEAGDTAKAEAFEAKVQRAREQVMRDSQLIATTQAAFLRPEATAQDRQTALADLQALADKQIGPARQNLQAAIDTFRAMDNAAELAKSSKGVGLEQAALLLKTPETFDAGINAFAAIANGAAGNEQAQQAQQALARMFGMDPKMPTKVVESLLRNHQDGTSDKFGALKLAQQLAAIPEANITPELKKQIEDRVESARKAQIAGKDPVQAPSADFAATASKLEQTLALANATPPNAMAQAMVIALAGNQKPGEAREKAFAEAKQKVEQMIGDLRGNDADKKAAAADRVSAMSSMISTSEFAHQRIQNTTYGLNEAIKTQLEIAEKHPERAAEAQRQVREMLQKTRDELIKQGEAEDKAGNPSGVRNAIDRINSVDALRASTELSALRADDPEAGEKAANVVAYLAEQSKGGNQHAHALLNNILSESGEPNLRALNDVDRQKIQLAAARQLAEEAKILNGAIDKADALALAKAIARVEQNPDANPELKAQLRDTATMVLNSKPLDLGNGLKFDGKAELMGAMSQLLKDGAPGAAAFVAYDRSPETLAAVAEMANGPGGAQLRAQIERGLKSDSPEERRNAANQMMAISAAWNQKDIDTIAENISPELTAALQEMPKASLDKHRAALLEALQENESQAAVMAEATLAGKDAIARDDQGRPTEVIKAGVVTRINYGEGDKPLSAVTLGANGKPETMYRGGLDIDSQTGELKPGKDTIIAKMDEQGRPVQVKRGDTTFDIKHEKDTSVVELKDATGKVLTTQRGNVRVDESAGDVLVSSRGQDMRTTETRLHFDGRMETSVTTAGGLTVEKSSYQVGKDGQKLVDSHHFDHFKADGQPATHPEEVGRVNEEVRDSSGQLKHRLIYRSMESLQAGKPSLQENIGYGANRDQKVRVERHELFDHDKGQPPELVGVTTKTSRTDTGEVSVESKLTIDGVTIEQTARFDSTGKALSLTRKEGDKEFEFELDQAGKVADVKLKGGEIRADDRMRLSRDGDAVLSQIRAENNIQKIEKGDDIGPTAARTGTEPSGTLVYRDSDGQTKQAKVDQGRIMDAAGKQIGTMQDSGEVNLTGKPMFRITDTEGAAFHGLGSDLHRLDLVSAKAATGFSGIFKSGDGQITHQVIGGFVYDKNNNYVGDWRTDERNNDWFFGKDGGQTLITSQFAGQTFTGKEGTTKRELVPQGTGEAPTGRIFIPNEKGDPVEYVVRGGMLIDKNTKEQKGFITSPTVQPDLTITGGKIQLFKPDGSKDQERELSSVARAVFELRINRGGTEQPPIQGVSLGATQLGADGRPVAGGFFSRRALEDADRARTAEGQRQVDAYKDQMFWNRWWDNYTGTRDTLNFQLNAYQQMQARNNQRMNDIFSTGRADAEMVGHLNSNIDIAKMLTARDRPDLKRQELDRARPRLEQLPDRGADVSGSVKIPTFNEKGEVTGSRTLTIQNGQLMDGTNPVGRILDKDARTGETGKLLYTDPKTGKSVETRMMDLKGAVWNLKFKEDGGDRNVNWVSVGAERGGIVSMNGLRMQAGNELSFASRFNAENHSDKSEQALAQTRAKMGDFEARLARITAEGVKSDDDVKFISEGVGKHVRSLELREGGNERRSEPIGLPTLKDRMHEVSGTVRIGQDVYEIRNNYKDRDGTVKHGQLMQVTQGPNGQRVVATTPSGQLNADFTVDLPGRKLNLGDVDRALVDLKVGKDSYQLMSLGAGRATQNFGYQAGGLYDVREFKRQIQEAKAEADKGNKDYFKDKPWLTGKLASTSWILGDVEDAMGELRQSIDRYDRILDQTITRVFGEGFDPSKFNADRIDGAVRMTQLIVSNAQSTARDNVQLAGQAGQVQKQINDAAVTAIVTVATAGIGSYFSAAATVGNMTRTGATVARIGYSALAGGTISTVGRMTNGDVDYILGKVTGTQRDNASTGAEFLARTGKNFGSGAIEGTVMSAAGAFGEWAGGLNTLKEARQAVQLARAGGTVPEALRATLAGTKIGRYAISEGATMTGVLGRTAAVVGIDATAQGTGFFVAGNLREATSVADFGKKMSHVDHLAFSIVGMGVGNVLGHGAEAFGKKFFSKGAISAEEIAAVAAGKKSAWDGLASSMMNNTISGGTNALVSAIPQAFDQERERIAQQLGISKEFVTGKLFSDHMKWSNIQQTLTESAMWGAGTGGFTTLATHAAIAKATAWSNERQRVTRETRDTAAAKVNTENAYEAAAAIRAAAERGDQIMDAPQARKAVVDHAVERVASKEGFTPEQKTYMQENIRKYAEANPEQPRPTEKQLTEWLAKQSTDKPDPRVVKEMTGELTRIATVNDHAQVIREQIVLDVMQRQQLFAAIEAGQKELLANNPYMGALARHQQFEPKFEFHLETQPGDSSKFNLAMRRTTLGADTFNNPQHALEQARHETLHAQQYMPIRLAAEIERSANYNPSGEKRINLVGDRVSANEQRQIDAYLARLTPQERTHLMNLGRQLNLERLGAESAGAGFGRAHEDFLKSVGTMNPEQAAQARKELMNNWLAYKFHSEEVRAAWHGEGNPQQNQLLSEVRQHAVGTPEHAAALERYVQMQADRGMLPTGLTVADARALVADVNAGKMHGQLQPEASRHPDLARGVFEQGEQRNAARTIDDAVENIRAVRSPLDDRAVAYTQNPTSATRQALEAELLQVARQQAKRLGLDPDNVVATKIRVSDLPDGVRGQFGAASDVLTLSLPKGIAADQVIPTIVALHEMRHRQHAVERTAFAKADPEGFRMAVADEVFLNAGAGGDRAIPGPNGRLTTERRMTESTDAPPGLRITAEQRDYMRNNLREFVRQNTGGEPPTEGQLSKWLLKQNGMLPEGRIVREMVGELSHYREVLRNATLGEPLLAREAGLRKEVERRAAAINERRGETGIADSPALQKLIRSISDDTTGIAAGAKGEYVFSNEEIRASRMEVSENLRRLVAEQKTATDPNRLAEINRAIDLYKEAGRYGNALEDVTRDMRSVRGATTPEQRDQAQQRLEKSAHQLLALTPDSQLETVASHLVKQGALKPEQVLTRLPIVDTPAIARAMVEQGLTTHADLLGKLPQNRMLELARDLYSKGTMNPPTLLGAVPAAQATAVAQMMMRTNNPGTGQPMSRQQLLNVTAHDAKLQPARAAIEAIPQAQERRSETTARTPEALAKERQEVFSVLREDANFNELIQRANRLDDHVMQRLIDPFAPEGRFMELDGLRGIVERAEAYQRLMDTPASIPQEHLEALRPAELERVLTAIQTNRKEDVAALLHPALDAAPTDRAAYNDAVHAAVDALSGTHVQKLEQLQRTSPFTLAAAERVLANASIDAHLLNHGIEITPQMSRELARELVLHGISELSSGNAAAETVAAYARRQASQQTDPDKANAWTHIADIAGKRLASGGADATAAIVADKFFAPASKELAAARRGLTDADLASLSPSLLNDLMRTTRSALQHTENPSSADLALAQRLLRAAERAHDVPPMSGHADQAGARKRLVANFDVVNDTVVRGGLPRSSEALAELKARGVQTVIDLTGKVNTNERTWAADHGLHYAGWAEIVARHNQQHPDATPLSEPVNARGEFSWDLMTPAHLKAASAYMDHEMPNGKVFVHCEHGRDRTGAVIAQWQSEHGVPPTHIAADLIGHGFSLQTGGAGRRVPELLGMHPEALSTLAELPSAGERRRQSGQNYNLAYEWNALARVESNLRTGKTQSESESRRNILFYGSEHLANLDPKDIMQVAKSLNGIELHKLQADQRRTVISNMLDVAENHRLLTPKQRQDIYEQVIKAIQSKDAAPAPSDRDRVLPRSLTDDLAYLRPEQLRNVIRRAAEMLNEGEPARPATRPNPRPEVQERTERLANRLNPLAVDRGTLDRVLSDLSPADRDAVVARLAERAGYTSEAGLRQTFQRTMEQLQMQGAVHTGSGSHGNAELQITAVANTTEGRALAYLFRKMTGAQVQILEPGAAPSGATRSVVSFDPPGTPNQSMGRNYANAPALTEFHNGVNVFNLASTRSNPAATERVRQLLGITAEMRQAGREPITAEQMRGYSDRVNAVVARERELATARGLLHLARRDDSVSPTEVSRLVDLSTEVMSTARAMIQSRRLHDDVMNGVPADRADHTVFVTLPGQRTNDRNAESAAWAMQVFREANGMSGREHDGRFLTEAQLQERLRTNPDSIDRVVIVQDAIGTGTEAFASAYRGATEVAPGKEVLFGAIGASTEGFAELRRGGTEFRTGPHNFRPFGDPASIEAVNNPRTRIERMLAGYDADHPVRGAFSRTTGWDENNPSSGARIRTGYAFPHMFPNSTPERSREMLRAMGLLGAYSERRVERPAGTSGRARGGDAPAEERQSRIKGGPSESDSGDSPSRFKTIAGDAEWMRHIVAEALKYEPTMSVGDKRYAVKGDEPLMIGASDKSDVQVDHGWVSRNHGELRYDAARREFEFTDHSRNGTYVTRANGEVSHIRNESVRLREGDRLNVGRSDGPEIQIKLPAQREAERPAPVNPLLSRERSNEVFVGNKPVEFKHGEKLPVGRRYELDATGARIDDLRVSGEHGSLRFDSRSDSFVYTDHSRNGTFIRRNGSNEFIEVHNRETKVGPLDEIRLGSPEGPQLEFYSKSGPGSRVDHDRAFFNGKEVSFSGNEAKITFDQVHADRDAINAQVSREHGTLKYDRKKSEYTYTDGSTNGTFLKRAGTNDWIRLHQASEHGASTVVRPGDQLRLGSEHGPELKLAGLRGRRTADGGIEFTNGGNGRSLWKDSQWTHIDGLGVTRTEDAAGRITSGMDLYGRSVTFDYDRSQLRTAKWSDGSELSSPNGRDWVMKQPDGQFEMWQGSVHVERDGALRFEDGHGPAVVRRLDGSSETHYKSGRIEYTDAHLATEQKRLNARIESSFGHPEQRERFRSMMAAFEARGLRSEEVAMTYHHINRMLNAGNESMVPFSERLQLAEQVMLHAMNPASVDQGRNKTCNVTTVEHRVFARKPSEAASMMADISITGKYTAADGKVVDLNRVGGLRPDAEALETMSAPFDSQSNAHADLKVDGQRTWASQIFENVSVNLHWQNHAREQYSYLGSRDVVGYTKVNPDPSKPKDTGERLFRFTYDPRTHVLKREQLSDSPKIHAYELTDIYNHIVGERKSGTEYGAGKERNFVIQAHDFSGMKPGDAVVVTSKEDFITRLHDAQAKGRMPMIAYVHTANPPFGNPSNPGSGGWHVINIQSVSDVRGGVFGMGGKKTKVEFTNQWGSEHDYTGARAVDADVIWAAMQGRAGKR